MVKKKSSLYKSRRNYKKSYYLNKKNCNVSENVTTSIDQVVRNSNIDTILNTIESILVITDFSFSICSRFGIIITRRDIESLKDGNWLNDNIINMYCNMIQERNERVFFFNTHFMESFNFNRQNIHNWIRRVDIFTMDKVFWPIHVGTNHWILVCCMIRDQSIILYDSKNYTIYYSEIFENIIIFLKSINNQIEWTTSVANRIPKQSNDYDCGMFVLKYAECLCRNLDFNFNENSMANFRKRFIYEIIGNQFLPDDLVLTDNQISADLESIETDSQAELMSEMFTDVKDHFTFKKLEQEVASIKRKPSYYFLIARDLQKLKTVQTYSLGNLDKICINCKAMFFKEEPIKCCLDGLLCPMLFKKLLKMERISPVFKDLFNGDHSLSNMFFENIRILNSIFSFTSIGISPNLKRSEAIRCDSTKGGFLIVMHGDIYHLIGSLLPPDSKKASFGQILFYDSQYEQVNRRMEIINSYKCKVTDELIEIVQNELFNHNQFYKIYKPIGKEILKQEEHVMVIVDDYRKLIVNNVHSKCYERPTGDDFAALIPENNQNQFSRDIIIRQRKESLFRINVEHPALDPLSYVLFYSNGDLGWSPKMSYELIKPLPSDQHKEDEKGILSEPSPMKRISLALYINFFLQVRLGMMNLLLKGRKLFHQYIVNKWIDIEYIRLKFLENNKKKLRMDSYKNILKAAANFEKSRNVGKITVLPSNYPESPRMMYELYQDSMAIIGHLGKPDLFLTMTCNVNWPEIQVNLFKGQKAKDRPELICRVFKLKMDQFIKEITKSEIFGKVKGYIWVVEFQKRGLPHLHMALILDEPYKIKTPGDIDSVVCAEIPNKEQSPELYEEVMKHMIHLPCDNKDSKCSKGKGDKCSKNFPKNFQNQTEIGGLRPTYRRRDFGTCNYSYKRSTMQISNRYVVPYNPYLLLRFRCHINVEVCSTVLAVKYLNKYIFKGFDRAIVEQSFDEVKQYLNSRYVSSIEATWRLKGYKFHSHSPTVIRLPVHLENCENYVFNENEECITEIKKKNTKLTAWFESNKVHPEFKHVSYYDYPIFFSWDDSLKQWKKRQLNIGSAKNNKLKDIKQNPDIVRRLHLVDPQNTELFYLRAILRYKTGAENFEDLKKVNNVQYTSFQDAARALDIITSDDSLWVKTLEEAILTISSGKKLRRLFTHMLMHCQINNPMGLWTKFKSELGDDLRKKHPNLSINQIDELILSDIEKVLVSNMKDIRLVDFKLPDISLKISIDYLINQINNETIEFYNKNRMTMIQSKVYDEIIMAIESNLSSKLFFIDAVAGAGKTFVLNSMIITLIQNGYKVISCASTGVASLLLLNGRTAHSFFKLPINQDDEDCVCNIRKNSELGNFLKGLDIIVWDEATLTSRFHFEAIDRLFRDICDQDALFGNKIIIFAGDFRQTLPIVKHGSKAEIIHHCIKSSKIWENCLVKYLGQNLRMNGSDRQIEFANYILAIGNDMIEKNEEDEIELNENLIFNSNNLDDFLEYIFPSSELVEGNEEKFQYNAILSPINEDVHYLNKMIVNNFNSKTEKTYLGIDQLDDSCMGMGVSEEILNSINQSGLPLINLNLKTGIIILLLRNIDISVGLCNGTKIIVKELLPNLISGEIIGGKFDKSIVYITRMWLNSDNQEPIKFRRLQFPIQTAFVMSVKRSQGQSLFKVGLYAKNKLFEHGQLYTVLSRGTNADNVKIFFNEPKKTISNIVYKEVL